MAEASAATLREMNPLVRVAARTGQPGAPPGPALLEDVDVAVLTSAGPSLQLDWDAACRAAGVAFYAAACHGSASYLFADLGKHTYAPTVRASTTVYHFLVMSVSSTLCFHLSLSFTCPCWHLHLANGATRCFPLCLPVSSCTAVHCKQS